jgi:hypothetical protein
LVLLLAAAVAAVEKEALKVFVLKQAKLIEVLPFLLNLHLPAAMYIYIECMYYICI